MNKTNNETFPLNENTLPLLTFRVAKQMYGLPVKHVVRIIEMVTITQLANVPEILQGIINLQGKAVPVMDLRRRFKLPIQAYGLHTPIILIDINHGHTMGLIVDRVEDVVHVPHQNLEITETFIPTELAVQIGSQTKHIVGVAKIEQQLVPVLAVHALLSSGEQSEMSEVLGQDLKIEVGP